MTPLNRAAQALHESLNTADISMNGDLATFAVIAVLKAVREADEAMIDAGDDLLASCHDQPEPADAVDVWTAMIDTILNEGAAK